MSIDPLAWVALGFLVVILGVSGVLGMWMSRQMKKGPGEK